MHNNYYFLRKVLAHLQFLQSSWQLVECFSQQRDELIMVFHNEEQYFFLKAHLRADFCCLSFPKDFNRSKKNSINLFPALIHQHVQEVKMVLNDRSFGIRFGNGYELLFKMHGNRANLILFNESAQVLEIFKNNLPNDKHINRNTLERPIVRSFDKFTEANFNYKELYPTFGKEIDEYLGKMGYYESEPKRQWEILQLLEQELIQANHYYLCFDPKGKLVLSLLKSESIIESYDNPLEALNQFFFRYIKEYQFTKEKNKLLKSLEKRVGQFSNYLDKTTNKLKEIENESGYAQIADIIMANLNQIETHAKEVELFNFYTNEPIVIQLKANTSPQKQAENLYRKSKNQKKEVEQLKRNLQNKENELLIAMEQLEAVQAATELKEIKKWAVLEVENKSDKSSQLPYKRYEYQGFEIWIGKNAKANDQLTLKYSYKDDLWLHAKDVSGSHVLLKYKSGQKFPTDVIERAAQLAAYYSKRRTDSLCPVIVTPKKYVRKTKGLPAGKVIVEREEVIMVEPAKI